MILVKILFPLFGLAVTRSLTEGAPTTESKYHLGEHSGCQMDLNNVTFTTFIDCVCDKGLLYLDNLTARESISLLGDGAVKLVRRKYIRCVQQVVA